MSHFAIHHGLEHNQMQNLFDVQNNLGHYELPEDFHQKSFEPSHPGLGEKNWVLEENLLQLNQTLMGNLTFNNILGIKRFETFNNIIT